MLVEAQRSAEVGKLRLPRVERAREQLMSISPEICPERAILITESYKQTEHLPMILRRAKALERILKLMPIYIEDDQLIVGNQAGQNRAAPIFPEYSIDWVIEELDEFHKRPGDVFTITEQAKEKLRSIHSYWRQNSSGSGRPDDDGNQQARRRSGRRSQGWDQHVGGWAHHPQP